MPTTVYRIHPQALNARKLREAVKVLNITLDKDSTALQMAVALADFTFANNKLADIEICDCCNLPSSVNTFPECPGCGSGT